MGHDYGARALGVPALEEHVAHTRLELVLLHRLAPALVPRGLHVHVRHLHQEEVSAPPLQQYTENERVVRGHTQTDPWNEDAGRQVPPPLAPGAGAGVPSAIGGAMPVGEALQGGGMLPVGAEAEAVEEAR